MVSGVRSGCARGFADGNGRAAPTNCYCNHTPDCFAYCDDGDGNGRRSANKYPTNNSNRRQTHTITN